MGCTETKSEDEDYDEEDFYKERNSYTTLFTYPYLLEEFISYKLFINIYVLNKYNC